MEAKRGGKVTEMRPGECVVMNVRSGIDIPKIHLTLVEKSGGVANIRIAFEHRAGSRARLRFHAPDSVEIGEPESSAAA